MNDYERDRRISELPPEYQQAFGLLDAKVAEIDQREKRKNVWRRIGKIALYWCAFIGALNMLGMAFYVIDAMMRVK